MYAKHFRCLFQTFNGNSHLITFLLGNNYYLVLEINIKIVIWKPVTCISLVLRKSCNYYTISEVILTAPFPCPLPQPPSLAPLPPQISSITITHNLNFLITFPIFFFSKTLTSIVYQASEGQNILESPTKNTSSPMAAGCQANLSFHVDAVSQYFLGC